MPLKINIVNMDTASVVKAENNVLSPSDISPLEKSQQNEKGKTAVVSKGTYVKIV